MRIGTTRDIDLVERAYAIFDEVIGNDNLTEDVLDHAFAQLEDLQRECHSRAQYRTIQGVIDKLGTFEAIRVRPRLTQRTKRRPQRRHAI